MDKDKGMFVALLFQDLESMAQKEAMEFIFD